MNVDTAILMILIMYALVAAVLGVMIAHKITTKLWAIILLGAVICAMIEAPVMILALWIANQ